MTLDRVLAVTSIVLGIPGFFALVIGQGVVFAAIAAALGGLAGTGWVAVFFVSRLPPFTVKQQDITLSFPNGRQEACLEKKYTVRANHRDQKFISFRNNDADGNIDRVLWDDVPVPEDNIIKEAGDILIHVRLDPSPVPFSYFSGTLKIYARDSFAEDKEFFIYTPDLKTKRAKIRIEFPDDSPCHSAETRLSRGAGELAFSPPTRSPDGDWLTLEVKKPKAGNDYKIIWRW